MIDDADIAGLAAIESARSNDDGGGDLLRSTEVVVQADAFVVEGSRRDAVAELRGQRVVGLRHARLQQFQTVLVADGRLQHVALARSQLQDARQSLPVAGQTRGRTPHFHVPTWEENT